MSDAAGDPVGEQLQALLAALPAIEPFIDQLGRVLVGHVGLKEAQHYLRIAMNTEALRRTRGSRRGAARILGVDRAYVRRIARGEH